MKKLFLGLTAVFGLAIAHAQQDQQTLPKVKEVGIGLTSFNSYSLQYRWGNDKRLFRLSGNIGGTSSSDNSTSTATTVQDTLNTTYTVTTKTTTPINLNFGFSFSLLKIKSVTEKLGFICGEITSFSYNINQTNTNKTQTNNSPNSYTITDEQKTNSQTLQPSIGIVMGAVYKINSSFMIYAEVSPNIYYAYKKTMTNSTVYSTLTSATTTTDQPSTTNTFGLSNLSNSGAMLTIAYRWTK